MNGFTWALIVVAVVLALAALYSWRRPKLGGWKSQRNREIPMDAVKQNANSNGGNFRVGL